MEQFLDVLYIFGLGVFGILLYAVSTVWKKIKADGFDTTKFFNDNKKFWYWSCALHLLVSAATAIVPDVEVVLQAIGLAVDTSTKSGYFLLGITLAAGANKTKLTGVKTLDKK